MVWLASLSISTFVTITYYTTLVHGLIYTQSETDYNLNQNKTATSPLDYWGAREDGHKYFESPTNWRFPFYTVFVDRFVNGDPTNDNINGTLFEYDYMSTQLRHGGDLQGLIDSLDYIAGMGIKGIYIAGSPFINQPWGADAYSPLDLTLLDKHFGSITTWQTAIDEIHNRGMWVLMDNTMATMGDLLGFKDYLNTSTPFSVKEHEVQWKTSRQYLDFTFGNKYNASCSYPVFWNETGYKATTEVDGVGLVGCYDSDFDQYGDIEAFGVHPDWQRELAKFASVQDRLRDWDEDVRARLIRFSCMTIAMLDIDGFRIDKAVQVTVDAQAAFSSAMRECASQYNKTNFMVVGEITSGNSLGSIYLGRGRQPDMTTDIVSSMQLQVNSSSDSQYFLRDEGNSALDGGAFHYSVYRFLTRFLGMSGNLEAGYDLPTDWVEMWNQMILTNDFYNANTGKFDPRHLYGTANQDVFRWPTVEKGVERMLLGYFITTLTMPGIPLVYYGDEQGLYIMDSTAENYVFGRQAFSPSQAWKTHGCYKLGSSIYVNWPIESGLKGCEDETQAYDHRDPSAPLRNTLKHMFRLREELPVLEHGWLLQTLSKQTSNVTLNGSSVATEFGIWSVARGMFSAVQNDTDKPVWLVYHNNANETTYTFDCSSSSSAFLAPFDANTAVMDLLSSDAAITLETSSEDNSFTGTGKMGCLSSITLAPYEFRAYVPTALWVTPAPMITKFSPGHDYPVDSTNANGEIPVSIAFNQEMLSCESVTSAVSAYVYTDGQNNASAVTISGASCASYVDTAESFTGYIPSTWIWSATLTGVADGIVKLTVSNATSLNKTHTNSIDNFLIRFGKTNNPVVYPSANYSRTLLYLDSNKNLYVNHSAAGASKYRYSTNWGSSWSNWITYTGATDNRIVAQSWSGTGLQEWTGEHVIVQYWSQPLGSSSFLQHGDSSDIEFARAQPHIYLHGSYNQWGYDAGLPGSMDLVSDNTWELHFMYEWPASVQLNIWGINPDNQPDVSFIYGDIDNDGIVDRLPPNSLSDNVINITEAPAMPYLSFKLIYDDATWSIRRVPQGNIWFQILIFILLAVCPVLSALIACFVYVRSFYQVKVNKSGFGKRGWLPLKLATMSKLDLSGTSKSHEMSAITPSPVPTLGVTIPSESRRTVLIATMEYNIDDWKIKIKIGGLGVMAQLMASVLNHMNLVWVVPCVGDVDYPTDRMSPAEPMYIEVMDQSFEITVYYHVVRNITYVLLDAPIFRKQTKKDPYIARMDDIESAILYAAWNTCIAESIKRFPVDIYHINDYHGAAAPLYLLPKTIPVCLSLHNAEFQGMWPMRTPEEQKEVCDVFNLPSDVVKDYVQYGSVFNLLHAGASYLRIHQRGFGAVGVSKKYGDRSLARYPIFWSLKNIGQLPNPDPDDKEEWDPSRDISENAKGVSIDVSAEENRANLRRQAQQWAGLNVDPTAELFVFVGRWSLQKGVDLIADIFPSILEKYPKTQLICIGPVIDLYGKFAALKLEKLMELYPGRVFSKPEFTQLPPYIFSGAEFALIPSRDEPFGLVAVEFGRKGALGVGARVGGLGQMPGFWYTIESMSPSHLLQQFRQAIVSALECKQSKRKLMRAWSAKQRFPVAQWIKQLDELHSESIRIHNKEARKKKLEVVSDQNRTRPSSRGSIMTYVDPIPRPESPAFSPGIVPPNRVASPFGRPLASPSLQTPTLPWAGHGSLAPGSPRDSIASTVNNFPFGNRASMASVDSLAIRAQTGGTSSPGPYDSMGLGLPQPAFYQQQKRGSTLSLQDAVGDRQDLNLQKVDQFFNDSNGFYYSEFDEMLSALSAKNSISDFCIETYLKKSEKEWFARYRDAKLGRLKDRDGSRSRAASPANSRPGSRNGPMSGHDNYSIHNQPLPFIERGPNGMRSHYHQPSGLARSEFELDTPTGNLTDDEFLLGDEYKAPTGLRKLLSIRVGDWPIYSFFLAAAQVISINSYQIVLLTGETSQTPVKLYVVAATYLITSVLWWILVRRFKSVYSLSGPWFFFGLAFLLLGCSALISDTDWQMRAIVQDVATAMYSAGASGGALAFALNFGDEGGSPTKQWITRALCVTGVQQVYSLALWYWGSLVSAGTATPSAFIAGTIPEVLVICIPIAVLLWAIGIILLLGLPDFYRQAPASIPGFYISLYRRKIVPWFFVMIIIQNYWLSAPYGRSWQFLFSTQYIPGWAIFLMALGFAVVLWGAVLYAFSYYSNEHTWLLPIVAIGLCAPRWAQEFWGTSGIAWYLPWVGSPMASAIVTRLLWLWLGLLDNIQGVGLGMILLATLTRQHVMAVLIGAQVIGAGFTMLARATSPNALSPNTTFPDFSQGLYPGLSSYWFWICLGFQLIIPLGFFKFFRKEQVAKP